MRVFGGTLIDAFVELRRPFLTGLEDCRILRATRRLILTLKCEIAGRGAEEARCLVKQRLHQCSCEQWTHCKTSYKIEGISGLFIILPPDRCNRLHALSCSLFVSQATCRL